MTQSVSLPKQTWPRGLFRKNTATFAGCHFPQRGGKSGCLCTTVCISGIGHYVFCLFGLVHVSLVVAKKKTEINSD